jgi:predicted methyltransferase
MNPSFRQFLELPLHQKLAFIRYLTVSNHDADSDGVEASASKVAHQFRRAYNQLPCSRQTRERRAQLFLDMGFQHKEVCLLGDDDLVAVELIRLGFTQVTVYDCDAQVLSQIADKIPDSRRGHLHLKQADFNQAKDLRHHFADLVCIDPPYHRQGIRLFMETALTCSRQDQGARLILMTVPLLFHNRRSDWREIEDRLIRNHFRQIESHRSFNAYPLDDTSRMLLYLASRLPGIGPQPHRMMKAFEFFSDCLVWERA